MDRLEVRNYDRSGMAIDRDAWDFFLTLGCFFLSASKLRTYVEGKGRERQKQKKLKRKYLFIFGPLLEEETLDSEQTPTRFIFGRR